MGNVRLGRGDLPKARDYYLASLLIKPDYAVAQSNLAKLIREEGRVEEVVEYFRAALAADPDNKERKKDFEEALKQIPAHQMVV